MSKEYDEEINKELMEEESEIKEWIKDRFMKSMDKYAMARAFPIFCLLGFFLGNSLLIYLWLFSIVYIYLYIYRGIRFYSKNAFAFLLEFCYFGNFSLVVFIFWFGNDETFFKIPYIASTGVMSIALVLFNNKAIFDSSDHITSSFIHAIPLISSWAIRWKHRIYLQSYTISKGYFLEILYIGEKHFEFNGYFYEFLYLPTIFWFGWAVFYVFCVYTCFRKTVFNYEKYDSGLRDFIKMAPLKSIFGDPKEKTVLKYIILHFINFEISSILGYISFYNFWFNTLYMLTI